MPKPTKKSTPDLWNERLAERSLSRLWGHGRSKKSQFNVLCLKPPRSKGVVLRVVLRGLHVPHGSIRAELDLDAAQADLFMASVLVCCGYELPPFKGQSFAGEFPPPPNHCDITPAKGKWTLKKGRVHKRKLSNVRSFEFSIRCHGPSAVVAISATHKISRVSLVELAEWLAPRLGWELYEEAA